MQGGCRQFGRKRREADVHSSRYWTLMTYQIKGLDPAPFAHLFNLDDDELAAIGAVRVTATADIGFPCRVTLEDAKAGDTLVLLNHVSHDVETPYRSA